MKKIIYLFFTCMFVAVWSCQRVLETKLDNSYGDEITWKLPDYALGVLMNAYANIPNLPSSYDGDFLDVATDNAYSNNPSSDLSKYVKGRISPTVNPFDNWGTAYTQFRNIHLFLERGLGDNIIYSLSDSLKDVKIRNRSRGEAHFLRAWWGMELLQVFGGITADGQALGYPIILKNLTMEDQGNMEMMSRNTYEECVLQIIADCDSAFKYLPLNYVGGDEETGVKQDGRANGRAALALQSRAALFGASPAYQPAGSFALSEDSVNKKWIRVVALSERAIHTGALGAYTALTENMYVGPSVQGDTNDEFIFRTWFNSNVLERNNFPPLFYGAGRTNPSQNLVDAYPAKNGFPISDARSGYDPQNPYVNRDNRFYLTIFYNGKVFNGDRPLEIYTDSNGMKMRDVAGYDYQNTATGYYLKKFMSPKKDMLYNPATLGAVNDFHQYPLIRRAEVYYNLAEALNEIAGPKGAVTGSSHTAYNIMKEIRAKNGVTATNYLDEMAIDKALFSQLIQNERRIEFAFENKRFFDLRRNLLPLNETIKGVEIVQTVSGFIYRGTDPDEAGIVVEQRNLDDPKHYYLPLSYDKIVTNNNLIQNKGW